MAFDGGGRQEGHGPRGGEGLLEGAVVLVGIGVMVAWILITLGDGLSAGKWNSGDWAAYGQLATTVVTAVGLAGVVYSIKAANDQGRRMDRQLKLMQANFLPIFAPSEIEFDLVPIDASPDSAYHFRYRLHLKNEGGPALAVRATLENAKPDPHDHLFRSDCRWSKIETGEVVSDQSLYDTPIDPYHILKWRNDAFLDADSAIRCRVLRLEFSTFSSGAQVQHYRVLPPNTILRPGAMLQLQPMTPPSEAGPAADP